MDFKDELTLTKQVEYGIRRHRLETELGYHKEMVEKNAPSNVENSDNFFQKLAKNTKNVFTKTEYDKHLSKIKEIESIVEKCEEDAKNQGYMIDEKELNEKARQLFENDKFGLSKLEFSINIILDKTIEYERDIDTFSFASIVLGFNYDYISTVKKDIQDAYLNVSYSRETTIKNVALVSSIVAIPLISMGVAGVAVGTLVPLGISESVAIMCIASGLAIGASGMIAYRMLDNDSKERVKEDFRKLDEKEASISIARTALLIREIAKYRSESEEAEELYESFIDEYIDLKSDNDLMMFMNKDNESLGKKNEIFHNADRYLFKTLKKI